MKSKMFFKAGSVASLIVFFVALLIGVLEAIEHVSHLWFAGSGWTGVLGDFEPVFSYIDIHFLANPGSTTAGRLSLYPSLTRSARFF